MKRLLVLIFLTVASLGSFAQSQEAVNGFLAVDREVVWQKVYETPLSFKEISDEVVNSALYANYVIEENRITGDMRPIDADYKGAGYAYAETPVYISTSSIYGFVTIEYKEGRYRVTLRKIFFAQKFDYMLAEKGERISIETYCSKNSNGELRPAFTKAPSKILDYTFSKRFDFNKKQNSEDW